jgi:radical SAM superfamily enzyme YgiQ (UPF0313 family)
VSTNKPSILLIKASYTSPFQAGVVHPLGIMTLASVLRNKGYAVQLLDLRVSKKKLEDVVEEFRPDVVGISALTTEAKSMHSIAMFVKSWRKDTVVISGGPHPTAFPKETLEDTAIDFIVLGEGEETLPELLEFLQGGNSGSVKGVGYRTNNGCAYTFPESFIQNIDEIPIPAWDLIEFEEYGRYKSESNMPPRRYASLFTSRGCPYRCIYCHNIFGKSFRPKSAEKIIEEIAFLVNKYNVDEFEVLDDIFNLDRVRLQQTCRLIIDRGLKIKLLFPNGLRTDLLDEESILLLRKAGTIYISFAVETASQRVQRYIKKNLNINRVKENIEIAENLGIITHGFFMFGFPTETENEARETLNFSLQSRLTTASFFIVTPFKNTELWEIVKDKINANKEFEYLEYFTSPFNLSAMDDATLYKIYRTAYRKFYLSFSRLMRILRRYGMDFYFIRYFIYLLRRMFLYNKKEIKTLSSLEE